MSDHQNFLTTLSHGQAEGLQRDVPERRRHDDRLQASSVEENLALAALFQRKVRNHSTRRRDEDHVPRSMCRLSEGVQLVLSSVENHVDGKIATGIVALRRIGDIRANQWRSRRDDETVSTHDGYNEGAGIRHVTNKDVFGCIAGNTSQPLAALRDVPNKASDAHVLILEGLVDQRACPSRGARDDDNVRSRSETQNRQGRGDENR